MFVFSNVLGIIKKELTDGENYVISVTMRHYCAYPLYLIKNNGYNIDIFQLHLKAVNVHCLMLSISLNWCFRDEGIGKETHFHIFQPVQSAF